MAKTTGTQCLAFKISIHYVLKRKNKQNKHAKLLKFYLQHKFALSFQFFFSYYKTLISLSDNESHKHFQLPYLICPSEEGNIFQL